MRTALHLISLVSESQWASGRLIDSDNTTDHTPLAWGVSPRDPAAGYAGPTDRPLEDGSTPHPTMHTHPRWVPHGTIKGRLGWRRIGQRPVFKTKVGLIRGAGGEVTFQVWAHHHVDGRGVSNKVAQLTKRADGVLRELTADLSHLAFQQISIELRVDAGASLGQDWAVWVDPQIEFDDSTDAAAEALTVTSAGDWSGVGSLIVLFEAEGGTAFGVSLPGAGRSVQFPLGALGLRRGGRYRVLTIPQGGEEGAWLPVPAEGNLVVGPSPILQSGVRFGDVVELTATGWAVDPAGLSRQLGGAMDLGITVGTKGLSELTSRGLKAPERILDALLGASPGQRFSVILEPHEAFGVLQGARPADVPRSALPVEPAVGMPFQLEGETETYWVVSIQGDNVRLDVNHPWAGYRIRFDGEITAVQRGGTAG